MNMQIRVASNYSVRRSIQFFCYQWGEVVFKRRR